MQIEDYFEFVSPEEIRLKGHRIWIENILYEHIYNAQHPAELAQRFPTLTLEQIYATLLYYQQNHAAMDRYLADWIEHGHRRWLEQSENPTPAMIRLQTIRTKRDSQRTVSGQPTIA